MTWTIKDLCDVIEGCINNKFDCIVFIEGNRGLGKCQIKGDKVLMSNGQFKNIEEIKKGDQIISPQKNGTCKIESVIETHKRHEDNVYEIREVTRNKKLLYTCAGNHQIPINLLKQKNKKNYYSLKNLEAEAISKLAKSKIKSSHVCSFTTTRIDYQNKKECEIEPYTFGIWLGDGHFSKKLAKFKKFKGNNGPLAKSLIKYGLEGTSSGTKFIPKIALTSSREYRLKLLAGIIDSDGYVAKDRIDVTVKSIKFAEDIKKLVFSLGGYSNIRSIKKKCQNGFEGIYQSVRISFENPKIIPLIIKKSKLGNKFKHNPRHIAIKSIKIKKPQNVYGFSMTGDSKWYITNNWMITHNSTLALKLAHRLVTPIPFKPKRDLVYSREDTIKLLASRKGGIIFSDEMINVAYNRDFYEGQQKVLIRGINLYRDSNNVILGCIPSFIDLDKQIQRLCKIRITVVRRGYALIHTQKRTMFQSDTWDIKNNQKVETAWTNKGGKNPRYAQLTTVRGILRFNDATPQQREEYEAIKQEKRGRVFGDMMGEEVDDPSKIFYDNLYKEVKSAKLTQEAFYVLAKISNKKPETIRNRINKMLKEDGDSKRFKDYVLSEKKKIRLDKLGFDITHTQKPRPINTPDRPDEDIIITQTQEKSDETFGEVDAFSFKE